MTGLQKLINCANNYIVSHGLRFNPTKTQCATFGRKAQQTGWFLGGCKLAETDRIQYLGAVISDNPYHHAEPHISACRRAFYALQGVVLCKRGTNPDTIRYLWMTVLRPVLIYGISCMNMPPKTIESLEKCQTKLLKATLDLISYCRNTPILQAMNIKRISQFIGESQRDVVKALIRNETKGLKFYSCILSLGQSDMNSIAGRTMVQCKKDDVSMIRYLYDDIYSSQVKRQCKPVENDGLVDSVKQILVNGFYNPYMLNLLLCPF